MGKFGRSTSIPFLFTSVLMLSACGGGGSSVSPPDDTGGTDDQSRAAAASATAEHNTKCSEATLGPYYWEIGDADGIKASGAIGGAAAPARTTPLWIFSSSKWLYAASVVQRRGVLDADVPFLNFTSGYSEFGNAPICLFGDTVQTCLIGRDGQDTSTVGRFAYDSGHMQHHAAFVMGLGDATNADLAADLSATIAISGISYRVPQLASGVEISTEGYAKFLQKLLRRELALGAVLGQRKVCTNPDAPGCNASVTAEIDAPEEMNYSLGHWVEDDPKVGDHAFSSAGGGGFYPWINQGKSLYGIVARQRTTEGNAGYHSAECGRLIRQAWRTGQEVMAVTPTPTP